MGYYYFNKHGAKRNADYFLFKMASCIPSHVNVIYDNETDEVVWTREGGMINGR